MYNNPYSQYFNIDRDVRQGDLWLPLFFLFFNIRNDTTDNFEGTLSTLLLLSTKVGSLLFTDYLLIIYIF